MKALSFFITIALFAVFCGWSEAQVLPQGNVFLKSLQKEKSRTDQYEFKHRVQLIVLAKLEGRQQLVRIKNDNFPDNTDIIYTVVKDSTGRIVAVEQVPYSESGDWYEEFKHYFDAKGNTFAFTIKTTVFDDSVKGGVAMWQSFNYYTSALNLLNHTITLTDSKEKPIKGRKSTEFDFRHDPYHIYKSVDDCLKACQIDRSTLKY